MLMQQGCLLAYNTTLLFITFHTLYIRQLLLSNLLLLQATLLMQYAVLE